MKSFNQWGGNLSAPHALKNPPRARFGMGFRSEFAETVFEEKPEIDWFEIITENFLAYEGRPRKQLEKLRAMYPIATHGVSLSIGSHAPLRELYLKKLKEFVDWFEPELVTDHLCFTRRGAHNSHDLLPVPFYHAVLEELVRRVDQVQTLLRRPILLENPSLYVALPNSEYSEAAFFNELCDRTGCGILLDLNNLEVNEVNLGSNAEKYLKTLKQTHVKQFHIAGHSVDGNMRIDTHDHPVSQRTWEIYKTALTKWPDVPLILERDAKIPPFQELHKELKEAVFLRNQVLETGLETEQIGDSQVLTSQVLRTDRVCAYATRETWNQEEEKFFNAVVDSSQGETIPGIQIYQNAYWVRLKETLQAYFPSLYFIAEEDGFWHLVRAYLKAHPPTGDSVDDIADEFESFLRTGSGIDFDFGVPLSQLADIVAIEKTESNLLMHTTSRESLSYKALQTFSPHEWENAAFQMSEQSQIINLGSDALRVVQEIREGKTPEPPTAGLFPVWMYVENGHIRTEVPSLNEAECLRLMHWGVHLSQICHLLEGRLTTEEVMGKCVLAIQKGLVKKCFQRDQEEIVKQ